MYLSQTLFLSEYLFIFKKKILRIKISYTIFCLFVILRNTFILRPLGLQRTMSVQPVPSQHQEPEAAPIATQSNPQNLTNPVQGAGRSRTARRLLPQPSRLVGAKCVGRRPGQLRVPVECVHQSSE